MDESEFQKLLEMFPVVRSRDYQPDFDSSGRLNRSAQREEEKELKGAKDTQVTRGKETSSTGDTDEAFWRNLKLAAGKKISSADAERFCKAFQQVYKKLVYEELTEDAAKAFMNSKP